MSLKQDRQRVRIASANLLANRRRFQSQSGWLRDGFEHYRPAIIIGGGFIAGLLIGRGNLGKATRSMMSAASLGLTLMRSSLGSILLSNAFGAPAGSDSRTKRTAEHQS